MLGGGGEGGRRAAPAMTCAQRSPPHLAPNYTYAWTWVVALEGCLSLGRWHSNQALRVSLKPPPADCATVVQKRLMLHNL